jgi:hypothetical protein
MRPRRWITDHSIDDARCEQIKWSHGKYVKNGMDRRKLISMISFVAPRVSPVIPPK